MNRMTQARLTQLEQYTRDIMEHYGAVGLMVSIFDKNGKPYYEQSFGWKDEMQRSTIDEQTIFGLASVTKSFTALSIMQLVERGVLDLYAPVSRYIPEFQGKNRDGLQLWHLMTHSAGYFPQERILVEPVAQELGLDEQRDGDFAYHDGIAQRGVELVAERLDRQTCFTGQPGEQFSYSNDCYALLTDIVRRHGGEPSYADYVKRHILAPLGMTRSGCDFVAPTQDENVATLYCKRGGELEASLDFHDNAFVLMGGGAMKSTIADMRRYVAMYLNHGALPNGGRIASAFSITRMCRAWMPYGFQGFYGLGLSGGYLDDLTVVGHGGALTGVSSQMSWSDEAQAGVLVLCNTSDIPVSLIADAAMRVFNGKAPVPAVDCFQECVWDDAFAAQVCGNYPSAEGSVVTVRRDDDGTLRFLAGSEKERLIPVSPTTAIIRRAFNKMFIRAIIDENGTVFALAIGSRIVKKA